MLTQAASKVQAPRPCASRTRIVIRCSDNGTTGAFAEGKRVKVTQSVKVYNAPKHPQGLDLQGMEGVLVKDVTQYKGQVLSANFPWKVEFQITADGKPSKFLVHMGEEELEAL